MILSEYNLADIASFQRLETRDWSDVNVPIDIRSKQYVIKSISKGDDQILQEFGNGLGNLSKDLFCPYPWGDKRLGGALVKAVENSIDRTDASFIILDENSVVGHFFLWKARANLHSLEYGLHIPELGIGIADSYQGLGIGTLCVKFLQRLAEEFKSDAVELTTALNNDAAFHLYKKVGFEYTGSIKNPLEVDVTAAISDQIPILKYRDERQMIWIINKEKKRQIIRYLKLKRRQMANQTTY